MFLYKVTCAILLHKYLEGNCQNKKNGFKACNLSMPNQRAQSLQLLMSTGSQDLKRSMPNQCTRSRELSMSTGTQALNQSIPNQ